MTVITLSRTSAGQGMMSVYGASDLNVGNVGQMSGSASFTLSETSDGTKNTVFDVIQDNSAESASFAMTGNNNNTRFTGYNMYASFDAECSLGYNVQLDTIDSVFDFSNTRSGAQIETTYNSANNVVKLGGGTQAVHAETIDGSLTMPANGASGVAQQSETRYFNNLVTDSGCSNVFLSSADSQTKFETTSTSYGAFIEGGQGNDVYNIGGKYGVFNGVAGNNIFTTAAAGNIDNTSAFNVVFGGVGQNVYNDFGMQNMYHGAYALYKGTANEGINGYDAIRMNGSYGIARVDASKMPEGYDPVISFSGSYNAAFTGDIAKVGDKTYDYSDILNGRVKDFVNSDGMTWSLRNFYGSQYSPAGYSALYGNALLQKVLV